MSGDGVPKDEEFTFVVYSPAKYDQKIEAIMLRKDHVFANREFGKDGTHKHLNIVYRGCKDLVRGWLRRNLKGESITKYTYVLRKVTSMANTINYLTKEIKAELIKCVFTDDEVDGFKKLGEENKLRVVKRCSSASLSNVARFAIWYVKLDPLECIDYFGRRFEYSLEDLESNSHRGYTAWRDLCNEYVYSTGEMISKFQREQIEINGGSLVRRIQSPPNFPTQPHFPWLCEAGPAGPAPVSDPTAGTSVAAVPDDVTTDAIVISDSDDEDFSRVRTRSPLLRRTKRTNTRQAWLSDDDTSGTDVDEYINDQVENLLGTNSE